MRVEFSPDRVQERLPDRSTGDDRGRQRLRVQARTVADDEFDV